MIPAFNVSNVLPPYVGANPAIPSFFSPYDASMVELVAMYATSPERIDILKGLLAYREKLRRLNITHGFQLIDGSFVENCEALRGRPPADVDIVTFAHVSVPPAQVPALVQNNLDIFDSAQAKATYKCDAYFVDLNKPSALVVSDAFYWFGLFSHQRVSNLWKGMLRIPIMSDDSLVSLP